MSRRRIHTGCGGPVLTTREAAKPAAAKPAASPSAEASYVGKPSVAGPPSAWPPVEYLPARIGYLIEPEIPRPLAEHVLEAYNAGLVSRASVLFYAGLDPDLVELLSRTQHG